MTTILETLEKECAGYVQQDCASFISDIAESDEIPPALVTLVIIKFLLCQTKIRLLQEGKDTTQIEEFLDNYVKKDLTDFLSDDIRTQYLTSTAKGEC